MDPADLIEKLIVANIKLYLVKDAQQRALKEGDPLRDLVQKDLDLCRLRGQLKNALNQALGSHTADVKMYGESS